jgi:uncharacterized membrane protein YagU involved in acid resistance
MGLVGGLVGTAAMTAAMARMHRELPRRDRYPLPPRRVAMEAAARSGLGPPVLEDERRKVTLVAHFGYGTAMGGVYSLVAPATRWATLTAGPPFGMAVWAGSYLGLLPALGLHPPATRESAPRNALMIAAHLVWGGTLAAVVAGARSVTPERPGVLRGSGW